MAQRRMFAKSVIGSARFLRMPASSRLLYYDLGMQADDDGVVEAFAVMRTTGATEDDLRILASKGFVMVLNEDLVTYITDWNRNNLIKKDRYSPSAYKELLIQLNEHNMEPTWNPSGTHLEPQDRLGKDRLGKDSGESIAPPEATHTPTQKPKWTSYGQYGWVKLTDEQYIRLSNELGETELKRCIDYVDESAQSNGNKNHWKDWNLVIRRCHRDKWGLGREKETAVQKPYVYDPGDTTGSL